MGIKKRPMGLESTSKKRVEGSRTSHHGRSCELTGIRPEKKEKEENKEKGSMGMYESSPWIEEKKMKRMAKESGKTEVG